MNGGKAYERLAVLIEEILTSFGVSIGRETVYEIMERLGRIRKKQLCGFFRRFTEEESVSGKRR